jgi:predicted HTH transcriptional regulator
MSAGWHFETILEIVRLHGFESDQFDYKEVLNASRAGRDEALASLRRTVCSMANADGGYILFGIRDRGQGNATPEDRIIGIPLNDDLLKNFWDKIKVIQPSVFFEALPAAVRLPSDSTRGVYAVRIPRSQRRPHMVEGKFACSIGVEQAARPSK